MEIWSILAYGIVPFTHSFQFDSLVECHIFSFDVDISLNIRCTHTIGLDVTKTFCFFYTELFLSFLFGFSLLIRRFIDLNI